MKGNLKKGGIALLVAVSLSMAASPGSAASHTEIHSTTGTSTTFMDGGTVSQNGDGSFRITPARSSRFGRMTVRDNENSECINIHHHKMLEAHLHRFSRVPLIDWC